LTSCPVVPAAVAAATLAAAGIPGSEQWLASALEGSRLLMPAWETLPATVVPRRRETTLAFWDGVVDGVLHAVPFGHEADGLIAFTDRYALSGPQVVLIDLNDRGVTRRTGSGSLDVLEPTCEIRLDGVPVSEANADAFPASLVQVLVAAELVGVGSAALEATVTYAKQRFQFGRAIGSFQAVKHALADHYVELDAARLLVRDAAVDIDSRAASAELAARTALCAASSAALRAANDGIQFHGGIGFTWEHTAHLYLKHAQSRQLILGSGDDQLHALADLILD